MSRIDENWCARRVSFHVRRLRKEAGVSQLDLATESGLTRNYLTRIETKGANLKLSTLQALAESLEVEPAEFLRPIPEQDD